ncbi:MAG: LysR family transcriptional regulator [Pelagimonas sp.]|jgi:molybdate transport repressor ModE-like protein|nr:LysR family transcriptional regulator [Pelagimonas sp.]
MSQRPTRIRRLKHIEAFSAVISAGSISRAARELGVSQPAVSQMIKALEDAIGAPLFVRRNGAIFPTSRAESLREEAVDLMAQLDRFHSLLSHQNTGKLSTIRLSASMSIANELLPEILTDLLDQNANQKFYVSSVPLGAMVTSLVQGHIDFAFHTRPFDHPSLHSHLLIETPQVAVMPADHPLATRADRDRGSEWLQPDHLDQERPILSVFQQLMA